MRRILTPLFLVFLFSSLSLSIETSRPVLSLDEIKPGMKGKGKTVFAEDRIEEFEVELLGVLHNFMPKKNLILARLKGNILDNAGVVGGMSGSPVYVEGKLVGAIAYSFPFAKEAIAGITPINEMLSISGEEMKKSSFSPPLAIDKQLTLDDIFEMNKSVFLSRQSSFSEGQKLVPISIPLVFNGFSSPVYEKAREFFSKMGFTPVKGGHISQVQEKIKVPDFSLKEGEAVGIQLVGGDISIDAIGTVTFVEGNRVLAFGHTLYNLGPVDYAMTKVRVITVVPSLYTSFKLSNSGPVIGRFTQDRGTGLAGELGKTPKLIPLNVKIRGEGDGEIKEFKVKIVEDRILTPVLVNFSLMNLLSVEERSLGDLTLQFSSDIYLEDGASVHLEDLYSGNFDHSVSGVSNLVAAVIYFLANNEFKELEIHRIDLNVQASEDVKYAVLEKVWLDKYEASPGEMIRIKIYSRNFRGESVVQEVSLDTPHLPPGSQFLLVIADALSMRQIEVGQYKSQTFVPRSLGQLLRVLNSLRKNNRIYFKIIASKPGLFLRGEEMPNLPQTMKSMFSSPRASTSSPTELTRSTLREYQYPVPYVFKGSAIIPIKINK